jgi:hypothetical protein
LGGRGFGVEVSRLEVSRFEVSGRILRYTTVRPAALSSARFTAVFAIWIL